MTHLLLWGNAYAQIIRNGKGQVVGLYPLMPNRMSVDRDEHGHLYYQYQMQDSKAFHSFFPIIIFTIPSSAANKTPATGHMIQVKSHSLLQKLHPR